MSQALNILIAKLMRETADKVESNQCIIAEDSAIDIVRMFSHIPLSKEQACAKLNLQRSRFDELVRVGILPKGTKIQGITNLIWYEDELNNAIRDYKCK